MVDIQETREQLAIEANKQDALERMKKTFELIFSKGHELKLEDKAFLQARQSYMNRSQLEEYKAELAEDLLGEPDPLTLMSRKELEAKATELGIDNPGDKKVFRTNQDLINIIKSASK